MKRIFLFLLILISFKSFSQQFEPGYILEMSGDTTRGLVRYQGLTTIAFGTSADARKRTYSSTEVKGFGFNTNEHYHIIPSNGQPVFAELVLTGKAKLYNVDDLYFAIAKDSVVQSLQLKTRRLTNGGREFMIEDR